LDGLRTRLYGHAVDAALGHVWTAPWLLDQKRTFRSAIAMSALPPKADICSALTHVGFGPRADMHERCLSKCSVLRVFTRLTFMPLAEPILGDRFAFFTQPVHAFGTAVKLR